MQALLNGIDPRGYYVTVRVSGKIAGGVSLRPLSGGGLRILGSDAQTDGTEGYLNVVGGGDPVDLQNLSMTSLWAAQGAHIRLQGDIRINGTGISTTVGLGGDQVSSIGCLGTANLIFSGVFGSLMYLWGLVYFYPSTGNAIRFLQDGDLNYEYFCQFNTGGRLVLSRADYSGITTPPNVGTFLMHGSADLSQITSGAPGGDTVSRSMPAIINVQGVALAGGQILSNGSPANTFGVVSATVESAGVYLIVTKQKTLTPVITAVGDSSHGFFASWNRDALTQGIRVYTRDASGALAYAQFGFYAF
jgi:hypothetical protein